MKIADIIILESGLAVRAVILGLKAAVKFGDGGAWSITQYK